MGRLWPRPTLLPQVPGCGFCLSLSFGSWSLIHTAAAAHIPPGPVVSRGCDLFLPLPPRGPQARPAYTCPCALSLLRHQPSAHPPPAHPAPEPCSRLGTEHPPPDLGTGSALSSAPWARCPQLSRVIMAFPAQPCRAPRVPQRQPQAPHSLGAGSRLG